MQIPDTRLARWSLSAFGLVSLIAVWEVAISTFELLHENILPPPSRVFVEFRRAQGLIVDNTPETLLAAGLGFAIAVTLAIGIAILFTLDDRLEQALMPFIVGGNSIPRVALAPLFVFYLGAELTALYALAAWIAFFPMFINAFDGFARIDDDQRAMLQLYDATTLQEYRYVRIPNALPRVFDGMKISIILAMIGAIVGEFVIVGGGLGNLALIAMNGFNTALVFATILVAGLVSTVAIFAVYAVQVKVIFWEEVNFFTAEM